MKLDITIDWLMSDDTTIPEPCGYTTPRGRVEQARRLEAVRAAAPIQSEKKRSRKSPEKVAAGK